MEQLKQKLVQAVNECNLPLEAIYYVSKDFFRDVDDTYKRYLEQSQKQNEKQEESE